VIAKPDERWSERPLACVVFDGCDGGRIQRLLARQRVVGKHQVEVDRESRHVAHDRRE